MEEEPKLYFNNGMVLGGVRYTSELGSDVIAATMRPTQSTPDGYNLSSAQPCAARRGQAATLEDLKAMKRAGGEASFTHQRAARRGSLQSSKLSAQ
mmetsp:Transcript_10526/g.27997  ORF Transcript_10526/g.27997 Transcript_10526/m.27997 type:complete len:96 (-) Transcript_10526:790-1077(-)